MDRCYTALCTPFEPLIALGAVVNDDNVDINELLMSIEADGAREKLREQARSYNCYKFRVSLPVVDRGPEVVQVLASDFSILPGGELMFFRTEPHEETIVQKICNVFASGEWIGFDRI